MAGHGHNLLAGFIELRRIGCPGVSYGEELWSHLLPAELRLSRLRGVTSASDRKVGCAGQRSRLLATARALAGGGPARGPPAPHTTGLDTEGGKGRDSASGMGTKLPGIRPAAHPPKRGKDPSLGPHRGGAQGGAFYRETAGDGRLSAGQGLYNTRPVGRGLGRRCGPARGKRRSNAPMDAARSASFEAGHAGTPGRPCRPCVWSFSSSTRAHKPSPACSRDFGYLGRAALPHPRFRPAFGAFSLSHTDIFYVEMVLCRFSVLQCVLCLLSRPCSIARGCSATFH